MSLVPDGYQLPDTPSLEDAAGSVDLGPGSTCETCGWNNERLEWYLEDGELHLQTSFGCYGGQSLETTDLAEAVALVTKTAREWPQAAAALHAEAERMRTLATAAGL